MAVKPKSTERGKRLTNEGRSKTGFGVGDELLCHPVPSLLGHGIHKLEIDLGISLTSFVKIVFKNQLRPTCIGQNHAIYAKISPNLSMTSPSLHGTIEQVCQFR